MDVGVLVFSGNAFGAITVGGVISTFTSIDSPATDGE